MKGGNGVSEANGITLCSKGEIPYCVSRKPPLDGVCLGRLVSPADNVIRSRKPFWIADVSPQKVFNHKEHIEHKETIGDSFPKFQKTLLPF